MSKTPGSGEWLETQGRSERIARGRRDRGIQQVSGKRIGLSRRFRCDAMRGRACEARGVDRRLAHGSRAVLGFRIEGAQFNITVLKKIDRNHKPVIRQMSLHRSNPIDRVQQWVSQHGIERVNHCTPSSRQSPPLSRQTIASHRVSQKEFEKTSQPSGLTRR
jgi:hypothetical protein